MSTPRGNPAFVPGNTLGNHFKPGNTIGAEANARRSAAIQEAKAAGYPINNAVPASTLMREDALATYFVEDGCQPTSLKAAADHLGLPHGSAWQVSRRPRFQARVRELLTGRLQHLELSGQRVLQELASIGFMKIGDVFDDKGTLLKPHELPVHVQAAVKQVEIESSTTFKAVPKQRDPSEDDHEEPPEIVPTRTTVTRYKFHDKASALQMLARHFKIIDASEEGVDALAAELAARLKAGRERMRLPEPQPVEDATIIEPDDPDTQPMEIDDEEPLW